MPAALSKDIRQRVIEDRKNGGFTYEEIADRLSVGRASVSRFLHLERETGQVDAKIYRPGPIPKVDKKHESVLRRLVAKNNDATEVELAEAFAAAVGIEIHRSSINRALRRMNITRKKRPSSLPSAKKSESRRSAEII